MVIHSIGHWCLVGDSLISPRNLVTLLNGGGSARPHPKSQTTVRRVEFGTMASTNCVEGSTQCPRADDASSPSLSTSSRPSFAINAIFLSIFTLSIAGLIGVSVYTRCVQRLRPESRRLGFSTLLGLTALLQAVAYASQLTTQPHLPSRPGTTYNAGLVLSTIAPVFLAIA